MKKLFIFVLGLFCYSLTFAIWNNLEIKDEWNEKTGIIATYSPFNEAYFYMNGNYFKITTKGSISIDKIYVDSKLLDGNEKENVKILFTLLTINIGDYIKDEVVITTLLKHAVKDRNNNLDLKYVPLKIEMKVDNHTSFVLPSVSGGAIDLTNSSGSIMSTLAIGSEDTDKIITDILKQMKEGKMLKIKINDELLFVTDLKNFTKTFSNISPGPLKK